VHSNRSAGAPFRRPLWRNAARAAGLLALLITMPSLAATITWTGNSSNRWFVASNWSPSTIPGAADTAVFSSAITPNVTLDGGSASITRLVLTSSGQQLSNGSLTASDQVAVSNGGTHSLGVSLSTGGIVMNSGELRLTISPTALNSVSGPGVLRITNGAILQPSTFTMTGSQLVIDGFSSRINAPTVQGTGDIIFINAGRLDCTSGTANYSGTLSVRFGQNGGTPGQFNCDAFNLSSASPNQARLRFEHASDGYIIRRPNTNPVALGGNMSLEIVGGVRNVLPGIHSYSGVTLIGGSGTSLELTGELLNSNVVIDASAALRGSGRVHRVLNVRDFGEVKPGTETAQNAGTLRAGSLAGVNGAIFSFDLSDPAVPASNDRLIVDGTATLAGRVRITRLGASGVYPLFQLGVGSGGQSFVLDAMPAGFPLAEWLLRANDNLIELAPRGQLQLQPGSMAFMTQEGSDTTASTTLINVGVGAVRVLSLPAPNQAVFTRIGGDCAAPPFTLAPAGFCTLSYRYAPITPVNTDASVTIVSDAINASLNLGLFGLATQRPLAANPTTLNFGRVLVNTAADRSVTISNPSAAAHAINEVSLQSGLDLFISGTTCGSSLASQATCSITLTYFPLGLGALSDLLRLETSTSILNVPITGTSVESRIFANGFGG